LFFDIKPKERLGDLFDRREEYSALSRLVDKGQWVVVLGKRMTGKTSLVKTFAKERGGVYVNVLGVKNIGGLAQALIPSAKLKLKDVDLGLERGLPTFRVRLTKTLDSIFSESNLLVFDEIQELTSPTFLKLLKYLFDTYSKLRIVFTGSLMGLLKRMLEPAATSPLYGRQPARIELKPFDRETSKAFLERGFKEFRLKPVESEVEETVNRLDGYVGWLTYYGNFRCTRMMEHSRALNAAIEEGVKVILEEINHFLQNKQRKPYVKVLRSARHGARWSELQSGLGVNDKILADILQRLTNVGYLDKVNGLYTINDPVTREAVLRLRA